MRDNNKIKFFIFTFLSFSLIILLAACKKDENVINNDEPLPKWKNIEIGFNNNYKSIFFINEFTGYAVGNSYPNDSSKTQTKTRLNHLRVIMLFSPERIVRNLHITHCAGGWQ